MNSHISTANQAMPKTTTTTDVAITQDDDFHSILLYSMLTMNRYFYNAIILSIVQTDTDVIESFVRLDRSIIIFIDVTYSYLCINLCID
jgi:hypothetical protein